MARPELKRTFNGYQIYEGDEPYTDVPALLRDPRLGILRRDRIEVFRNPLSPREEEQGLALQDTREASGIFERNRQHFHKALQAIVGHIMNQFDLPRERGLDIGSGATGAMVEDLMGPFIAKDSWVQMDVNPGAVTENRRRHPHSHSSIIKGSYLNLLGGHQLRDMIPIITGLSSLDNTHHIALAVHQIRSALHHGGYLFHMQDVRPGMDAGLREAEFMGLISPFFVEVLKSARLADALFSFSIPGEGPVPTGELFRRNLGRTIQSTPGMELLFNQWVTARRTKEALPSEMYYMNSHLKANAGDPVEEVSAVVTVARRI